jgi:hypothetical protein
MNRIPAAAIIAVLYVLLLPAVAEAGEAARAVFTTGVENHEPVGKLTSVPATVGKVRFFTVLSDMQGRVVTHRWEHQGQVMAEVTFHVDGLRSRVWSSKRLLPGWTGHWTVSILDAAGQVMASRGFDYGNGERSR